MNKLYGFIKKHGHPLFLILLPLIFFSEVLFDQNSMLYPSQDIISIFSQEKQLFQDTIDTYRTLPLWNPYIFSGSPFLGNPTSSMFYPINILFLLFSVDKAFGYIFIINSMLIGIFTYSFARSINLDKFSSLISGIIIMFSGPLLTLIFPGHLVNFDTFVWFPLILLVYDKAIKTQKIIYAIFAGFPIALTLLAGASQIAAFSLLSALIYFTLRLTSNLPKDNKFLYLKKIFLIYFTSIIIGLLLSAVQILPTSEFSKLSARANGLSYDFASDFSLHPKQIISFIFPYFFGDPASGTYWGKGNFWSLNGYVGIIPLILALIAVTLRRYRFTAIFLILGLFALLFSLGKYAPIFPFFFNHIPGFNSFRTPARFLYFYAFSIVILAGIGIEVLIRKISSSKKLVFNKISIGILLVGLSTFCIFIIILTKNDIPLYEKYILNNSYAVGINHYLLYSQLMRDLLIFSLILLIFSTAIFLKIKNKMNAKTLKISVLMIILFDLWFFNSRFASIKKIYEVYATPDLVKTIKKDVEIFRIFDKESLYLPIAERNKIENITGVHSLYIKDYRDFLLSIGNHENKPYESFFEIKDIKNKIFLDLLNVKYVITNNKLIKNPSFFPRAYMVPNAIVTSKNNVLNQLQDDNFDPKNQLILQKKPNVSLTNSSLFKEVKIVRRNPNQIHLKVSLENPGFLVLSEIYYPGWKAYDNGQELEIYNANFIFRSIYLYKGNHDVYFVYDPDSYKIGKAISITTLLLCLLFLGYKKSVILVDIRRLFL